MSADCSVANNPLVHLNKQAQGGPAGPSARQFQQQRQGVASLHSSQTAVSDRNLREISNFQRPSGVAGPMGTHMPSAPLKMAPAPLARSESNTSYHSSPGQVSEWSREFSSGSSAVAVPQLGETARQNSFTQSQQSISSMGGMGSMSSMAGMSALRSNFMAASHSHQQPQGFSAAHAPQQTAEPDWEQQFGELEREVSQNLNISDNATGQTQENAPATTTATNVSADDVIIDDTYQETFQKVWDDIHDGDDDAFMPDRSKYLLSRMTGHMEYEYEDSKNEYLHNPNAYKIGCILMENGAKLSEAAMAFEAAVQENPEHVDAWLRLGLVQIQNEKELNGICALERCLKLDGANLEAMKTLAVSYINEGYDMSALTILNQWIGAKYPNIEMIMGEHDGRDVFIDETMGKSQKINEKLMDRFKRLSAQLPQVDPDVELCLGLLYYADDNYEKTIDCFKRALTVNPNDELMWNRLGAALANSNRSEESIQAYHKALNLKPSFVRARYNLAVSCLNIGCYKEAAEHLLATLSMHEVEGTKYKQDHDYSSYNNDNIIETLKRVFISMNRNDLLEKVQPGMDLSQFKGEFTF
ncbi:Pex5 protein [Maudiozyma humilis]|uniref:Pex5 protein n=1 Tax=Maudiozyma humilis TaxID=51915 RepID=A0AAV5RXV2_MAUHU|nr:Pex5 protein [Kazachstania humilis]